jgi:hypothetical protein
MIPTRPISLYVKRQLDPEVCMRKVSLVALVAVSALAVLAPSLSHAQWNIGARAGYMHGFGEADATFSLDDFSRSQIPFQLDVGYRVGDVLILGGYFSYGVGFESGFVKDSCDAGGIDCSASSLRFGGQVLFDFPVIGPWLGLGLGYESVSVELDGVASVDMSLRGVEWVLQGGWEFPLMPKFAVGPYASVSMGRYVSFESDVGDGEIADKSFHGWASVGLRGTFDL